MIILTDFVVTLGPIKEGNIVVKQGLLSCIISTHTQVFYTN